MKHEPLKRWYDHVSSSYMDPFLHMIFLWRNVCLSPASHILAHENPYVFCRARVRYTYTSFTNELYRWKVVCVRSHTYVLHLQYLSSSSATIWAWKGANLLHIHIVHLEEEFIIYLGLAKMKPVNQTLFCFLLQKTVNNVWVSFGWAPIKHCPSRYQKTGLNITLHTYIGSNRIVNNHTLQVVA
jgi:hypothetical protein